MYCYAAQSGLSAVAASRLLDHLSRVTPSTATGCLDDVNLALVMAALASFNVSGADTEDEENVPMVRDKDFIADISRELEVRETPGLLSLLQLAGQHFSQLLATISSLYAGDKLDLDLADLYWCSTELADTRHCPAKQVEEVEA